MVALLGPSPRRQATGTSTAPRSLGLLVGEWLILLHAGDAAPCTLPPGGPFTTMIDSTRDDGTPASTRSLPGGTTITIPTGGAGHEESPGGSRRHAVVGA